MTPEEQIVELLKERRALLSLLRKSLQAMKHAAYYVPEARRDVLERVMRLVAEYLDPPKR